MGEGVGIVADVGAEGANPSRLFTE